MLYKDRKLLLGVLGENDSFEFLYNVEIVGCNFKTDVCILRNLPGSPFSSTVQELKLTDECDLEDPVRLFGFPDDGEDLVDSSSANLRFGVLFGDVSRHCKYKDNRSIGRFKYVPREEIAVSGRTPAVRGYSGGPCIDKSGKVVGMQCRVHIDCERQWYIVPSSQIREVMDAVEESPRIGADGSSRVPLEDVGGTSGVPLQLAQDDMAALVGRSNEESPMMAIDVSVAPYGAEMPDCGGPTVWSFIDDDEADYDALSSVSGNGRASSCDSPSGHAAAPSRCSLEESLRAAHEEIQRLHGKLRSSENERVIFNQARQEELCTAETERPRSLAQRIVELEGANAQLVAVMDAMKAEFREMKRELAETKLGQSRLEEKQGGETPRRRYQGRKRQRIHDGVVSEDSCSCTSDCDCSESSVSLYDDSTADDHETVRCPSSSQAWTQSDVNVVKDAFRLLGKVSQPISTKCDVNSGTLPDWSYHCKYAWAEGTSICHTFLFSKGAPPNTMAEVAASVLRGLIKRASKRAASSSRRCSTSPDALFRVEKLTCLRTGMLISTETNLVSSDSMGFGESATEASETGESKAKVCKVEMLVALVDASPDSCLAASSRVDPKMQRLIVCAKGLLGEAGEHVWRGGLDVVLSSIRTTLNSSCNFDEHEIVCPTCLNEMHTCNSGTWSYADVSHGGSSTVCCQRGHHVEKILICGTAVRAPPPPLFTRLILSNSRRSSSFRKSSTSTIQARGIVQVLVQTSNGANSAVGSGFVSNKKLGEVVTSGHLLWTNDEFVDFAPDGQPKVKPNVKLLISVPSGNSEESDRYFEAKLAYSDYQKVDACVLRVVGSTAFSSRVQDLKLAKKFHLLEYVRLCGFNLSGEGRYLPNTFVDSSLDVVPGVISKHCNHVESAASICIQSRLVGPKGFFPDEEIAVSCVSRAIEGQSGGPCINERGEVVGILSRVDVACATRAYFVPFNQIRSLIER